MPQPAFSALSDTTALHALGAGKELVLDGLLGDATALAVRAEALALDEAHLLRPSGTGASKTRNPAVRGDRILWLDRDLLDPALGAVVDLMDAAMATLNANAYLGAGEVETQVAIYDDGPGYLRHRDALHGHDDRRMTAIYYANDWRPGDGGELVLYDDEGRCTRLIEPIADRLVLFLAQTEHAVRPVTRGPRVAVSGFMRRS